MKKDISTTETRFRGNYRRYDQYGSPVIYQAGDIVEFEGKRYLTVNNKVKTDPTSNAWKKYDTALKFYISNEEPNDAHEGDKWLYTESGNVYTFIVDNNGSHWVEF